MREITLKILETITKGREGKRLEFFENLKVDSSRPIHPKIDAEGIIFKDSAQKGKYSVALIRETSQIGQKTPVYDVVIVDMYAYSKKKDKGEAVADGVIFAAKRFESGREALGNYKAILRKLKREY